ncbi:hypothetical protein cypCar_00044529 [Cyprinus carpio]|nr:hypothetical protein cypCar_00044529 [Cyprinus carpio]
MTEDKELISSTETFKKLYSSKWSEMISHTSLVTLNEAKFNKPSTLPFTQDVQSLHRLLEKTAHTAFQKLQETSSPQSYAELGKATLARIIVFNRRRAGEVSKMLLKGFNERDGTSLHEDVAMGLSKFEQKLCSHFSRVEIRGKRGRKVAVLLSPDMVDALTLLVSSRRHDIHVHCDYYRLPEATTQLAKISKLLLAMEKGCLPNLQGKSLDDIEIEDEINMTDSDDSDPEESDSDDDALAGAAGDSSNAVYKEKQYGACLSSATASRWKIASWDGPNLLG